MEEIKRLSNILIQNCKNNYTYVQINEHIIMDMAKEIPTIGVDICFKVDNNYSCSLYHESKLFKYILKEYTSEEEIILKLEEEILKNI